MKKEGKKTGTEKKYGARIPSRRIGGFPRQEDHRKIVKGKKEEINKVLRSKIKTRAFELVGEGLSALSNETRVNIVRYIQENKEASFEELRRNFNLNNNTLTFHLQKLRYAHIVSQPKDRGPYQVDSLGDTMLRFLDALEGDVSSDLDKILA